MAFGGKLPVKLLMGTAQVASMTWPVASALFPEKLEVDDNQALWVRQSPPYTPGEPLRRTIDVDLAIIGGGFTGVSTAYHFSRRYPEKRVALLEAKSLANGASGRNGGMLLNWLSDHTGYSDDMLAKVYHMTSQGIQMMVDIIKEHNLDVSYRLDGTLHTYTDPARAEAAHAETEHLNTLGVPGKYLDSAALREKLNVQGVYGAVLDPGTGQINGAQLVRGLRPVLVAGGVEIYEGTPVLKIREGSTITLTTPEGEVRAKAIMLATNGYTGKLGYFQDAVFPLHSHVFATAPLTAEQQAALGWHAFAGYSDDLDRISYSVVTREGNIVFGGGSNQSYAYLFKNRTAYPGTPDSAPRSFAKMRDTMTQYFPQTPGLPIQHRWTGTLGITLRRNWLLGVRGEHRNVYYSVGYCGHGVTLANVAGKIITQMISGDDDAYRGLPFYQASYGRIPPEPFRWIGYQFFTRLTGKSPRI